MKNIFKYCLDEFKNVNGIIQLTDLPDINIDESNQDKYIGYEHIGEFYSSEIDKKSIREIDLNTAEIIKKEIEDGILLDLGCGDGVYTIPLIKSGVIVIAGDISNKMMEILQRRMEYFNLDNSLLTLVRMNAYDIPINNNSIDSVIANSMLHLNSSPEKIINEIYRVLKPNGKFICFDDVPGKKVTTEFDNSKTSIIIDTFYKYYWKYLSEYNIVPVKYSWRFDRDKYCTSLFSKTKEIKIKTSCDIKKVNIYNGFYTRMKGRGFSDQTKVPNDIHENVFKKVDKLIKQEFGLDYLNIEIAFYEAQKQMKIYIK